MKPMCISCPFGLDCLPGVKRIFAPFLLFSETGYQRIIAVSATKKTRTMACTLYCHVLLHMTFIANIFNFEQNNIMSHIKLHEYKST